MRSHSHRSLRRFTVVALLGAGLVLGLLPPALGRQAPRTEMRSVPVAIPAPEDPAASVVRSPGAVLARQAVWTRDTEVCADIQFTSVGLTWRQDGDEQVPVHVAWGDGDRFSTREAVLSDPDHAPDPGAPDEGGRVGIPVVWTGEGRCLRFSMQLPQGEEIRDLRVEFLNTSGTARGRSLLGALTDGMARVWGMAAPREADALARRPPIIRRAGWGADESLRRCGPSYADRLKMAYVHHTATGNDYSAAQADDVVRAIYAYHTRSQGWCDIAYNFLVDRFGRIYEGRHGGMARPVIGGHAMGFNTASTGVALIGDHTTSDPSAAALRGLRRVLAWRLDVAHLRPTGTAVMVSGGGSNTRYPAGREVRLPVISGHRETGYTTCPGDRLWNRLPSIRRGVEGIGLPKIWSPRQSRDALDLGQTTVTYRAVLSGSVSWRLEVRSGDGAPVRSWTGTGTRVNVTWDGMGAAGGPLADGTYRAFITARDGPDGPQAREAVLRLSVTLGCTHRAVPGEPLLGTEGPDVLCGTAGDDIIRGRGGNDLLMGFEGDDVLEGGPGNDVLVGGPGDDTLRGGGGDDTLRGDPGQDSLLGGTGTDTATYADAPRGVDVDLAAGTATGWGRDSLGGIQKVIGSRFGDVLRGDDEPNVLEGRRGADVLLGRGGGDVLRGGAGDDRLVPGAGGDRLVGGGGEDTADYSAAPAEVIVDLAAGTATGWGEDRLAGIWHVMGSRFDDALRGDGKANRLAGRAGDDVLAGRGGRDALIGGAGRDTVRGGPGNDTLRARDGERDVVRGGPGSDRAFVDRGLDDVRGVQRIL